MKKNTIYKTVGLYTEEELEQIKKDYECRDIVNGEYNDIDEEDLQDYNDVEWNYSFGDEASWKTGWVNNTKVIVVGELGLWNGNKKITPKQFDNIMEAVSTCIKDMDEVEIYEDAYANLKIDAYHHDGTNHFTIKKYEDKKQRCLHFTDMWNKYLIEENEKWIERCKEISSKPLF